VPSIIAYSKTGVPLISLKIRSNTPLSAHLRIPERSGHLFQKYPATHSDFIRPLIPEHPATL